MLMVNTAASYTKSILLPLDVKLMTGTFIPVMSCREQDSSEVVYVTCTTIIAVEIQK